MGIKWGAGDHLSGATGSLTAGPEWQNLPFFCYFGSLIGFGHLGQIQVSEEKN